MTFTHRMQTGLRHVSLRCFSSPGPAPAPVQTAEAGEDWARHAAETIDIETIACASIEAEILRNCYRGGIGPGNWNRVKSGYTIHLRCVPNPLAVWPAGVGRRRYWPRATHRDAVFMRYCRGKRQALAQQLGSNCPSGWLSCSSVRTGALLRQDGSGQPQYALCSTR